ncbi:MAG: PEP-CTERM sorting domain-containing protein [Planctomycetota bacterium]
MRRFGIVVTATVLFSLLAASQSHAYATWWTGTTGDWHDPLNWDNGIPGSSDWAYIDNGGTAQISADAESDYLHAGYINSGVVEQAGGTNTVSSYLYLAYSSGSSGTYNLSGTAQLSVFRGYIGRSGTGEFNQTGGTHAVGYNLWLGYESGSGGTYNLSAGELSVDDDEYIGRSGTGEFNQDGGTHSARLLHLGYFSGSSGTYNLSAGELSVDSESIGHSGPGEFNQTGGTHTVGYLYVKDNSSYTLSSGTLFIGDSTEIYGSFHFTDGDGALNVNGGLVNFTDGVIDGAGSASFTSAANSLTIFPTGFDPVVEFGSYNALGLVHTAGSTLVISAGEGFAGRGWIDDHVQNRGNIVASGGSLDFRGGLTISEGGTLDSSGFGCDFAVDNGATVTIAASGGELSALDEHIGHYHGTGEFNQYGGTHTVSSTLYLGRSSSGVYNLSAGELSVGSEYIGHTGTGEFNQTGGTHAVGYNLWLGYESGSGGTYNLSAGELSVGDDEYIGYEGTGEFNQDGGTHTVEDYLYLGHESGSSGTYNLSGTGELFADFREYIGYEGTGEFNQTGGIHTLNSDLYLGYSSGSSGTYNLSVGELSVNSSEYIGYNGPGEFNQTGGINSTWGLYIDPASTYRFSSGTLIIKEGGSISGTIDFDHNAGLLSLLGGITDIQDAAFINAGSASFETAANSLTILPAGFDPETAFGSTDLKGIFYTPGTTMIVYEGQSFTGHYDFDDPLEVRGTLIASGGMFGFKDSLTISNGGTLDMSAFTLDFDENYTVTIAASGGNLYTESVFLGNVGEDVFNQHQGVHSVTDTLYIGYQQSGGTYNLTGGELNAGNVVMGLSSTGEFNQDGGTHNVSGSIQLAYDVPFITATYNLNDGALATADLIVGEGAGRGMFNQSGGTLSVSGILDITSALGIYNLDGGSLEAHDVLLAGKGVLNITSSDAYIEISGSFTLQDNAVFMAVPGTMIHMTGSNFENKSTSLNNLGWLQNTTFTFEDSSDTDTFEIASYDYGLIEEHFYGNFGLEGLVLAGSYNGTLQLLDAHVNFTGLGPSTQSEALYVRTLVLGGHATLDLNGYNLYAMEYTNYGGTVLNGEIQAISSTYIPEPATIALISAGLLGLAGVLRRKLR